MAQLSFITESLFSPNGEHIAIRASNHTGILNPLEQKVQWLVEEGSGFMAFSNDSKYFALATFGQVDQNYLYLFEVSSTPQLLSKYALDTSASAVAISNNLEIAITTFDNHLLILTYNKTTQTIDLQTSKLFDGITSFYCKLYVQNAPLQILLTNYSYQDESGKEFYGTQLLGYESSKLKELWQKASVANSAFYYPLLQGQIGLYSTPKLLIYTKDRLKIEKNISIFPYILSFSKGGNFALGFKKIEVSANEMKFQVSSSNLVNKRNKVSDTLTLASPNGAEIDGMINNNGEVALGIWGRSEYPTARAYHLMYLDENLQVKNKQELLIQTQLQKRYH